MKKTIVFLFVTLVACFVSGAALADGSAGISKGILFANSSDISGDPVISVYCYEKVSLQKGWRLNVSLLSLGDGKNLKEVVLEPSAGCFMLMPGEFRILFTEVILSECGSYISKEPGLEMNISKVEIPIGGANENKTKMPSMI